MKAVLPLLALLGLCACNRSAPDATTLEEFEQSIQFAGATAPLLQTEQTAETQAVRDLLLADYNLLDMQIVQDIRQRLVPADRPAFATYVARHLPYSAAFCGDFLLNDQMRQPVTIGQAIDLTKIRDREEEAARIAALRPPTPSEKRARQRDFLDNQKDYLIAQQTMLAAEHGPDARQRPEWQEIDEQLADYDRQIAALTSRKGGV